MTMLDKENGFTLLVRRLRRIWPMRLLEVVLDLESSRFTGRLVLNYNMGRILSVERRAIEHLDRRA